MKKFVIGVAGVIIILFTGCSAKKIAIKAPQPAEVDFADKRVVAVIPFRGDNINFSGRVESKLANVKINNKPYFKVVSRDKIDDILKELKLQSSELVGKKAARFGKLAGAEVIITGNVKTSVSKGWYKKPQERCAIFRKGKCLYFKTVYITCHTSDAVFNASISAIDVNTAQIIDAFNINKKYHGDSCSYTTKFKTAQEALNDLAEEAADEYVFRITPHYVTLKVELIDEVESVNLTSKQEKMFENALIYIQHSRLDKAEKLLKKLNEELNGHSYEIAYDLGVVEEALGKYKEAKAAYELADLDIEKFGEEPNELVDKAIKRINELIEKEKKLKKQLNE